MWINTVTQEVYRSHSEIRASFPQTSFPSILDDDIIAGFNILSVISTEKPKHGPTKNVIEGAPVFSDGAWRQTWDISDATENEIAEKNEVAAKKIRAQRDKLLAETDWMALSDNTMTDEWAVYRQALRDITSQTEFPHNVVWPTKPE